MVEYNGLKFGINDVEDFLKVLFRNINSLKENIFVPKNKKNKIGIILAFKAETKEEKIKIDDDIILQLKQALNESKSCKDFNFVKFSPKLIYKIQDNEAAKKYLSISRSHFIIYGGISSKRKIQGKDNYIIRLHGMVRYAPIIPINKNNLDKEFSSVLPKKIEFLEDDEALGFEFTEERIKYVVKYVVGMAAFASGDLALAKNLYYELENEINLINKSDTIPVISEIKGRLPIRISEVLMVYLDLNYNMFTLSRDRKFILDSKKYLLDLKRVDPDNYKGHLIRAIYYFFCGWIELAINELNDIVVADFTWRYSLGFLKAYQGDIDAALLQYKKVLYKPLTSNVVDIEIFISEVIEKEPDKVQLVFFRGLLNYKIKHDYNLARNDFNEFNKSNLAANFPQLLSLASKYLSEIKDNLGI